MKYMLSIDGAEGDIVDVDNLDKAIALSERLPPANKGTVKIRPLFPLPQVSE